MSIIGSLRSCKLKAKQMKREQEEDFDVDSNLTLHERVNQFVQSSGDIYILPYLDAADIQKVQMGKSSSNDFYSEPRLEQPC